MQQHNVIPISERPVGLGSKLASHEINRFTKLVSVNAKPGIQLLFAKGRKDNVLHGLPKPVRINAALMAHEFVSQDWSVTLFRRRPILGRSRWPISYSLPVI